MKTIDLKKRLKKDRPMTMVSIRLPQDIVVDLKRVAPQLGFSGYQPIIRTYIGQGLRQDLVRLENTPSLDEVINTLRRHGVEEQVITEVLAEMR